MGVFQGLVDDIHEQLFAATSRAVRQLADHPPTRTWTLLIGHFG